MPERIQRSRAKGWRMPPNTVCVTRPGKWGNMHDWTTYYRPGVNTREDACRQAVEAFLATISNGRSAYPTDSEIREKLRGKHLACWCKIISPSGYVPCHADVLLSIANDIPMEEVIRENYRRAKGETL